MMNPANLTTCPTCGSESETRRHFLRYKNLRRRAPWGIFAPKLRIYLDKTKTPEGLAHVIVESLRSFKWYRPEQKSTNSQKNYKYQVAIAQPRSMFYGRFAYENRPERSSHPDHVTHSFKTLEVLIQEPTTGKRPTVYSSITIR